MGLDPWSLAAPAIRIGLAILLDAAAFIVWDIGTRTPTRLIADLRTGLRAGPAMRRGLSRFVVGGIAIVGAVAVCLPVAPHRLEFTVVQTWAIVTALAIEQLIGPDVRAFLRRSPRP